MKFEEEHDYLEAQKALLALKKLQIRFVCLFFLPLPLAFSVSQNSHGVSEGNRRRLNMQQIYEEHRESVAEHQRQEREAVRQEWEERRREFRLALQQELLAMKVFLAMTRK